MRLIAIVYVEHSELALVPTIKRVPSMDVRVVASAMTDPETEMFFFLVRNETGDFDGFETALADDDTVTAPRVVCESDTSRLYRFKYPSDTKLLSPKIIELGGLVLEAKADGGGWRLRLQLPDRGAVAELWEYCYAEDIAFELDRVFEHHQLADESEISLSDKQRAALVEAYRDGYFEEPRETSQTELAERLDVCSTAVGGRLRRGVRQLIEDVLLPEGKSRSSPGHDRTRNP